MSDPMHSGDPMAFMKNLWGNMAGFSLPGMVTPTLDVEDLDKRIADLKTVEGWLRMNLSMLQMTIQGLEMQSTTLSAVRTMSQMATQEGGAAGGGAEMLSQAAMWPWALMQQMQAQMQESTAAAPATAAAAAEKPAKKPRKN
jgi:hypothetical protein